MLRLAVALILAAVGCAPPVWGLTIARDGRPAVVVVVAEDAIPAERTAARELAHYLELVCGTEFSLRDEADLSVPRGPAIWVGPTALARSGAIGFDPAAAGPEDWHIETLGDDLILAGGRPRGTLYAVYRFLEDHVGVRWWTRSEESVPSRRNLQFEGLRRSGRPAFAYRDVHGVPGSPGFLARSRINGHFSFVPTSHGGRVSYGPPFHAHTFYRLVPPSEHFAAHPEYYAEIDGRRTAERSQLCLSQAGVVDFIVAEIAGHIEASRARVKKTGEPPPTLFSVSQNDWGRPCRCRPCRELVRREGAQSGALIDFVNRVADRLSPEFPGVLVDTLAYHYTFAAPRRSALRDNVALRLAALQRRNFARPVRGRGHREYRRAIDAWAERTRHLRIWDYAVTFGPGAGLPLANWRVFADDFRYYRDRGVEGIFVQHDAVATDGLSELRLWILLHLLEDPDRDVNTLVREFTDGYYGPAGSEMRGYLDELERSAARRRPDIGYPATPAMYRHLDPPLLRLAQSRFDRAEALVRDDPVLLRRVREARISLDRATLLRWSPVLSRQRRGSAAGRSGGPLDPVRIAERFFLGAHERIGRVVPQQRRAAATAEVEREMRRFLAEHGSGGSAAAGQDRR